MCLPLSVLRPLTTLRKPTRPTPPFPRRDPYPLLTSATPPLRPEPWSTHRHSVLPGGDRTGDPRTSTVGSHSVRLFPVQTSLSTHVETKNSKNHFMCTLLKGRLSKSRDVNSYERNKTWPRDPERAAVSFGTGRSCDRGVRRDGRDCGWDCGWGDEGQRYPTDKVPGHHPNVSRSGHRPREVSHIVEVRRRHNTTHRLKGRKNSDFYKVTYMYAVKQIGKWVVTCESKVDNRWHLLRRYML